WITNDVAQLSRVITLGPILGIPDHFVNKVAQVQDKAHLIAGVTLLVLPDHPAVRGRRTLLYVLATHKGKAHRAGIALRRRCERASDAATEAMLVGKAIPILVSRPESGSEHAAGPIRCG